MLTGLSQLLLGVVIVFIAAVLFVNSLEYVGYKFRLGGSFVGAILAPIFTSFPEMTVFLVAISSTVKSGEEIGIGTIFGQPFMASSLSYGLVGFSILIGYLFKKRDDLSITVDRTLIIPYIFITIMFPLTLLPSYFGYNKFFGVVFLLVFFFYVSVMFRKRKVEAVEDAERPYISRFLPYSNSAFVQLAVAVLLLYYGSSMLVEGVDQLSTGMSISAFGLSLIVIPAATAIPETASALIWGYRGRDTLSIGSLVGEKILYSTFYPALGLFLTSWNLNLYAVFSVFVTSFISLIMLYFISRGKIPWYGLCVGIFFFIGYSVLIFAFNF